MLEKLPETNAPKGNFNVSDHLNRAVAKIANSSQAKMSKQEFVLFLESLNRCYSLSCADKLPQLSSFPGDIFCNDGNLRIEALLDFASAQSDKYLLSVVNRMIAIINVRQSRDHGIKLDIENTWRILRDSIVMIPSEETISSIGSQRFLGIPIYNSGEERKTLEFIKLHIWDDSLSKYYNREICDKFSIHSHAFSARSWVIFGKVVNDRYDVETSEEPTAKSLFTIAYNRQVNVVTGHTSNANNTGINVYVKQVSHEVHMTGGSYQIKAGDFHRSDSMEENGLSATIFSFTAKDGLVDTSYVVGPSNVMTSEINRKMHIEPKELLMKVDSKVNHE